MEREKELQDNETTETTVNKDAHIETAHEDKESAYPAESECDCKDFCEDECKGCRCNKNGDENFEDDCDCEKPKCPLCSTGKKVACGITIGVILAATAVAICEYFKK